MLSLLFLLLGHLQFQPGILIVLGVVLFLQLHC